MAKWTDEEIVAAIEQEEQTALNWADGPLASSRAEALRRFNRDPYGNEQDGRSQVVSNDIADAVEGVMPALARVFLAGDEVGKFEPTGPEDQGYEIESEVVNWYITQRNDGFNVLYQAFKDALLLGNAYVKTWWQTSDVIVAERYQGLSDEEATLLLQDRAVSVTEHAERQDPELGTLHDLKLERTKPDEYVAICPVPPDELLVSSRHREASLANADFVQHRRTLSIGELRELGYDVPDDIGDDVDDDNRQEAVARDRYNAAGGDQDSDGNADPTRRQVTLRETWMRLALEGKKQALWRFCLIGKTILHREEADLIPIAAFSPIFYPHSHVGISFASLLEDLAELNTTVLRQYLDNLYLANSTQVVVDVNRANIDDFLISRPGGIKRVEGNPADVAMPMMVPDMGGAALQAMEFINALKENRTGLARVNQGSLDPNSLNRTATGASMMLNAGQQRLELIARCLAGGVRDLFLLVHAIAQKHSTRPMQIKLQNGWTMVDPREWTERTNFTLSVALGTGNPEAQMGKLTMIGQFMQQGMALGLVGPQEFYNWGREVLKNSGYRNPDMFLKPPQKDPQTGQPITPPRQPDPLVQAEQIKLQGKQMELQANGQLETQKVQMQAAAEREQAQLKATLDERATANQMAQEQRKAEMDYELRQQEAANKMQIEKYKADLQAETQLRMKLIEVAGQALLGAGEAESEGEDAGEPAEEADPVREAMPQLLAALNATMAQITAAKRIVRNPTTGRAEGIVSEPQPPLQ